MDKKPIIIGNWKMKLGIAESLELAKQLKHIPAKNVDVVVCPSFVSLSGVIDTLRHSSISVGAQDCFWESEGAFTGETSAAYLREIGASYVILGHSERRKYLGETDEMVHKKIKMALTAGLTPIVCVGETFEQRQEGSKDYVLIQQTVKALEGVPLGADQRVFIAYEPVWVIGSGQAIDPAEAAATHQVIRQSLFDIFPSSVVKSSFSIIYGGSVDANTVNDFTSLENTDGVLVGGASLTADSFRDIIQKA